MSPQLEKGGPPGATFRCSHNGSCNEELFLVWIKHFTNFTKPTAEDPLLLIMDNHGSHITLESYKFCKENHIHVVSIPPHSSHRLRPLDLAFFGPLKTAFNAECDRFLRANRLHKITVYDIASFFNEAYVKVATMDKEASGFKAAGIFPYNPEKFGEVDFIPETDCLPPVVLDQETVNESLDDRDAANAINESAGVTEMEIGSEENENKNKKHINVDLADVYRNPVAGTSLHFATPAATQNTQQSQDSQVTKFRQKLLAISPLQLTHDQGQRKTKRRPKQHPSIVTGTPMELVLKEAKKIKDDKVFKAKTKLENQMKNPKITVKNYQEEKNTQNSKSA